jgi:hypothetical protein
MNHLLWGKVLERFPKLPKERECITEKTMRDAARQSYYERLLAELEKTDRTGADQLPLANNGTAIG